MTIAIVEDFSRLWTWGLTDSDDEDFFLRVEDFLTMMRLFLMHEIIEMAKTTVLDGIISWLSDKKVRIFSKNLTQLLKIAILTHTWSFNNFPPHKSY